MNKKRFFTGLCALLTAIGLARALQHYYIVDAYEPVQFGLWWHIPFNLFLWWSWLLFIAPISWIAKLGVSKRGRFPASLLAYFLAPLLIVGARQAIAAVIINTVLTGYATLEILLVRRLLGNFWVWLDIGVYFIILLSFQMMEYRRQHEASVARLLRLQGQLSRSRLNALESQLRPHFLFNTLNALSTLLLKEDGPEASRMLTLLQNFLRVTVDKNLPQSIPLKEEIQFITQYLEIERTRFKDKLKVTFHVDQAILGRVVPRFLLQPIVENAICHAIEPNRAGGTIDISAEQFTDSMRLTVTDDGSGEGVRKKKQQEGVGLKITRQRLENLYGDQFDLSHGQISPAGYKVSITLPYAAIAEGVPLT